MKFSFTLFLLSIIVFVNAQQIAFPTAEGAGRFTTGGRGTPTTATTVFEVTDLTDNVASPTPGSFRYAVTNNSPAATYRTIIFRVSGTIRLAGPLSINRANTTIAGQTAPGDGICIADYPVTLSANNVIVRYIRFRLGDRNQAATLGNDDAFSGTGRNQIIIDHCSMSWSNDETFTFYSGNNITLQWNVLSEPLDRSFHDEGTGVQNHAYGGIWGGRRATFHHNLIAHVRGRAPRFDGVRNLSPNTPGLENANFVNNVIYNWADYNVNGGEGGNYNIINNYYKAGPSTPSTTTRGINRRNMIINPYAQTSSPVLPYGKYYVDGNFVSNSATVTANNWLGAAMNNGTLSDTGLAKVIVPFLIDTLNIQSATDAYNDVLARAGASLPKRDTLDARIVNDVINSTGRLIDVQGGYPQGTPFSVSQTAWPTLNTLPAPVDTDHDGMPNAWEANNGSDPNNAADRNTYSSNGYTLLENYLNNFTTLPLKLIAFSAVKTGQVIATSWTTNNEINTKDFSVERSADGNVFTAIANVKANNTPVTNKYVFTDASPLNGVSFYRLKMYDLDGRFTYSYIIKINAAEAKTITLYPNPASNQLILLHPSYLASVGFKIVTADGKTVKSASIIRGAQQTTVDISSLQKGAYYVVVANQDETSSLKFIKK